MILAIGGILMIRHAAHSPFGYALRAARDSERQAEATGIHTKRVQWVAESDWLSGLEHQTQARGHPFRKTMVLMPGPS